MKKFSLQLLAFAGLLLGSTGASAKSLSFTMADTDTIQGRWDITIDMGGKEMPSWLEVDHSGTHRLIGYYVGPSGSARPISKVDFSDSKMSFSIPPQWEEDNHDITFEGTLDGNNLSGTMTDAKGESHNWKAVRAPKLIRTKAPVWGKPMSLFNGKDTKGWHTEGANQWKAEGGILRSPHSGSNLISDEKFNDFKLHIEFRYPKGSNSGVYLRGRYEVQVADSKGKEPLKDELGAVYGFIAPSEMVAKNAGEWQTYDITLIGRMVTVVANGKMIICNREIPGITGGALDSNEGEAGPLLIQGDHGPVDFRNIIITPAK
ncbi:MAG TPA: DUF1080 domain-containing protein [Hanamia sp.]|nr:DUF1080 domain-containing protein [Hanamia sp.]